MISLTHIHTASLDDINVRMFAGFTQLDHPELYLSTEDLRLAIPNLSLSEEEVPDQNDVEQIIARNETPVIANGHSHRAIPIAALLGLLSKECSMKWLHGETLLWLVSECDRAEDKAVGYSQHMAEAFAA